MRQRGCARDWIEEQVAAAIKSISSKMMSLNGLPTVSLNMPETERPVSNILVGETTR